MANPVSTTPVRPQRPIPTTRSKMEPPARGLRPTNTFTETRLNRPPIELGAGLATLKNNIEILTALQPFRDEKKTAYDLGVDAINAILHVVHDVFAPDKPELVCVNIHKKNIRYHPHQHFYSRADYGILRKSTSESLLAAGLLPAYHHFVSAGELKTILDKSDGPKQLMTYLGILGQALPTHVSLLGFSCWSEGYTLHYSSPSGVECSEDFSWDDLVPFLEYAYTLYCAPEDQLHLFFDQTIELSPDSTIFDPPRWNVTVGSKTYEKCRVRMVGQPWHRMSWIVENDEGYIIKDQHRSDDTTFTEGELYDILHQAGYAPGFAVKVSYTQIVSHGQHIKINVGGCSRTKTRIVLATKGAFLHQCESLVKFLRVMNDVLESHRHAVNQDVLHRDLSQANILIDACHVADHARHAYSGKDRPRFSREILEGSENADPESLIIDFDNACRYNAGSQRAHNPLHERTGTPKYIARSVSLGRILTSCSAPFEPMPELPNGLAQRYEEAYRDADDPLRTFKDTGGTIHGGRVDTQKLINYQKDSGACSLDFQHHPHHDAESLFWCLLAFLMRALPATKAGEEPEKDINEEKFQKKWKCFQTHEIPDDDDYTDSRSALLDFRDWEKILHHKLSFVSPMINELIYQVKPEYAVLDPPPHKFHLHEAIQRILLKYADSWEDKDINLNTQEQRKIPISEHVVTGYPAIDGQHPTVSRIPTASKRKAQVAELPARPTYTSSKQKDGIEEAVEPSVPDTEDSDSKRICLRSE